MLFRSKTREGASAKSLTLTGNQFLKYSNSDYSGIPTPSQSILTATPQGLSGTPIKQLMIIQYM